MATDQPRVYGSPNPEFIREKSLKAIYHLVRFLDALFPVYKQKKGGLWKKPSLIYTEDMLKWSNEKYIDMGMGNTCYPIFLPLTKDEFERHVYLFYISWS